MEPITNKNPTIEEVLAVISKTAKDTGVDDFRVRVQRRRTAGGMPEQVLTMDGALAEHFSSPETWLPRIAGGGLFIVSAYHVSNVANVVGGPYPVQVDGQSRDPDPAVVEEPGWKGPRICVFPKPASKSNPTTPQIMTIPGGTDATPRNVAPVPPGEGRPNVENAIAAQFADVVRREQALFARQAQVEIEAAKREAAGSVERVERKLEDERRRNEEERRRLEEDRRRIAAEPKVEAKSDDKLEKVLTVLGPLALEFLKSDREFKQQALQLQLQAAERQAAATAAATAEQSKQMAAVLASIANKPAIDPQLFSLLTKEDSSAKVLSNMSELFATQASTTMNVLNSMVEMGLAGNQREPEEPQALKLVREGVKAFVTFSGNAARAVQPPPQQPRPVEAGTPIPTPAAPEPELRAAEPNVLEQFIGQVRNDQVPPEAAAAFILDRLGDASVMKAYLAADSDLRLLLVNNLGEDWLEVPANVERARAVMKGTLELGVKREILDAEVLEGMDGLLASIG